MSAVNLRANVPLQLALTSPEGELDNGIVYFETTSGTLQVTPRVAGKINELQLRIGEPFSICKYSRAGLAEYNVWLTNESERGRAVEEAEDPESLIPILQRSIERVPRKPAARVDQPQAMGTGTNGPAPQRAPIPATAPTKPSRVLIPYNVAFREVTQFVTAELKASGEQWSDQARQDLISTVLIAAAKQGFLGMWERENA